MGKNHGLKLSVDELLEKLKTGEWVISGGRELYNRIHKASNLRLSITKAEVRDGMLRVRFAEHDVELELSLEEVFLTRKYRNDMIEVRQPYVTRCQRPKADGGGDHEIPVLMPALQLVNKKREDERLEQEEEQRRIRSARWIREYEENERRHQEQEQQRIEARARFLVGLNEYVGKKVSKITVSDQGYNMCLEFDDGTKLEIVSQDNEDYCSWLIVNEVSLNS